MRGIIVFALIFLASAGLVTGGTAPQKFDKADFYAVMKSGGKAAVDNEIELVKNDAPPKEKDGYEGALLMKKAGLAKKPKDRLSFFKAGVLSWKRPCWQIMKTWNFTFCAWRYRSGPQKL